jgi:hypothetical protein
MKKPRAVNRAGILTRTVPDFGAGSCDGCMYNKYTPALGILNECKYPPRSLDVPARRCVEGKTIYIEATDEAWAQYLMSKIRHNLGEPS